MKPVYVLPNLFTTASLFAALFSIISTSNGHYRTACLAILASAVFDALDGPVARLTRSSSSFGVQYDSLADTVAFGIAPAFLMYSLLEGINNSLGLPVWAPRMALGVCALYAVCGAIRLARFNVQVEEEEKLHFTGMPIPAAAGTIVSTYLVLNQYLPEYESKLLVRALMVLMVILAYLMVSTYPFPSLKGLHRRFMGTFGGLVTIVFIIFLLLTFREHLALFALVIFYSYITFAVVRVIRHKRQLARYSPGTELILEDRDLNGEEL